MTCPLFSEMTLNKTKGLLKNSRNINSFCNVFFCKALSVSVVYQVHEAYDGFQLSRVPLLLEKFINTHVSSFYCHHTKDR